MKTKYIDLCRGEIRVGFSGERITSLCGGPADPIKRKYVAIDALRKKIGELNAQLEDCITATAALDHWDPPAQEDKR